MVEEQCQAIPILSTMAWDMLNISNSTAVLRNVFIQTRQQLGDTFYKLVNNSLDVLVYLRDWIRKKWRKKGLMMWIE